jgi:hypothetical protein
MNLALVMMAAFVVKHFVCDFHPKIQTPAMYLNKGTYGHPGGIAHAFVHVSASCLILWAFSFSLESSWPFRYAHVFLSYIGLLVFEGLVHYHMDWFKIWWCKRKGYKPDTHPQFWLWLGIDQLVHYLTYIVMVLVWI